MKFVDRTFPGFVREYIGGAVMSCDYDYDSQTIWGHVVPTNVAEYLDVSRNVTPETTVRLIKALVFHRDAVAVFMANAVELFLVYPDKVVHLEYSTGKVDYRQELTDVWESSDGLIRVGYEKTYLYEPNAFQPIAHVLFNPNNKMFYIHGKWERWSEDAQPIEKKGFDLYTELVEHLGDFRAIVATTRGHRFL